MELSFLGCPVRSPFGSQACSFGFDCCVPSSLCLCAPSLSAIADTSANCAKCRRPDEERLTRSGVGVRPIYPTLARLSLVEKPLVMSKYSAMG
jgi:hypothetical protein